MLISFSHQICSGLCKVLMFVVPAFFLLLTPGCAERVVSGKDLPLEAEEGSVRTDTGPIEPDDIRRTEREWFDLGQDRFKEGKFNDARQAFKRAIRMKPGFAEAHYHLGLTYNELGDIKYMQRAFKEAVRIRPDYTDAHYSLAILYRETGDEKSALESFRNVIKTDPDNADVYYQIGDIYLKLRLKKEAKEAFVNAIRIKPDFADAHYSLGTIYVMFNDIPAAFEEYKILVDLERHLAYKLFNQIYK